ncbi:MAG: EamA family transporter [Planctomycetota bacterium]
MKPERSATAIGLLSVAIWATNIGVLRTLIEALGPFLYVAVSSGCGGVLLYGIEALRRRSASRPFRVTRPYLLGGGLTFLLYVIPFCWSFSRVTREITIELGLVNYLWPMLILVFSIPLLGHRARWRLFLPGIALGVGGVALSMSEDFLPRAFFENVARNGAAFAAMFFSAACWGVYSNLAKKYHKPGAPNGIALFQLAAAAVCGFLHAATGEVSTWDRGILLPLAYYIVFPTSLGYLFWEIGMKKGDLALLGAASYFLPLGSMLFACRYLGVPLGWNLLAGAVLLVGGAVLSKKGIAERAAVPVESSGGPAA